MKFKVWPFVFLLLLTLPAVLPFFIVGFPSTHDGVTHVERFLRFYQALAEGQIIPRWTNSIAFGLGSPVLMYNSYLPYLAAEVPRLLGAGWALSVEIIFAVSFMLSAATFYLWSKDIFGKVPGFVGALFYVWAPYRFVDMYVRGAFPESVAFIFPPLILLSAKKIIERSGRQWFFIGTISLIGLILSHNVMTLLFVAIYFLYSLILVFTLKDFKRIKPVILSFVSALSITAAFWVPAFFEKGEANLDRLNVNAPYLYNFADLKDIIYSHWGWGPLSSDSPMSPQLGVVHQLAVVLVIILCFLIVFHKKRTVGQIVQVLGRFGLKVRLEVEKVIWVYPCIFILLLIISIFLMTAYSLGLWSNIGLLSFFLYPWRFLALAVFSMAIVTSFLIYILKSNKIVVVALMILLFYSNKNHLKLVGLAPSSDYFYQTYTDTTDMWGEFLPVNTNLEIINKCKVEKCSFPKVVVPKDVLLLDVRQNNLQTMFDYTAQKDFPATINTLYFPGWNIYLDGDILNSMKVNSLGTMDINLPAGNHKVDARFTSTLLRDIAGYTSLFSGVILFFYLWKKNYSD